MTGTRCPPRATTMKRGFVLCACGNDRAASVNIALGFLKRFTKYEIVVARARSFVPISHDQVMDCGVPQGFTDRAATISLKTAIHHMLPAESAEWCFLDSHVIAVDSGIDRVFDRRRGPVAFPRDEDAIHRQSPQMLKCGCRGDRCRHLRQAIKKTFGVTVGSGSWVPWDPAVFVFGPDSLSFLDLWHQYAIMALPSAESTLKGITGDRWALTAAAWKSGLQNNSTLPKRFHRVVDGFQGIPREEREYLHPSAFSIDKSYSLTARGNKKPVFLHFVNHTIGAAGWKNWDDVSRLVAATVAESNGTPPAAGPAVVTRRRGSLPPIHGMWVGASLSRMELLTLRSFVRQGHRFHLWAYDAITTPIPEGVVLEDATRILPRSAVFARQSVDPVYGVGRGSYGSPFSDLFRYKLLHDMGGYWADMDVTCLKPFPSDTPYLFRTHRVGVVGNIMKCPRGSRLMAETYEQTMQLAGEDFDWMRPNKILSENINRLGLTKYIRKGFCNPDSWAEVIQPFIEHDFVPPCDWYAIHWINEIWRTLNQDHGRFKGRTMLKYTVDKDQPKQGTTLARLYEAHGLDARLSADSNGNNGARRHPAGQRLPSRNQVNVLVPTLAIGGAERIVVDTLSVLGQSTSGTMGTLFLMDQAEPAYPSQISGVETVQLCPGGFAEKCALIASRVLRSGTPTLFVHLGPETLLRQLWGLGVRTIPVVHNTSPGWPVPAALYNDSGVPFVIAVCEKVAQELREHGCLKRIVVVRHEIARTADSEDRAQSRKKIRARYGIGDETLLVGMVGQFKRQKDYPKAVRVLAELQRQAPAKLLILGPWDHSWGDGRQVFAETYRTACDLNVVPDLIAVGAVIEVEEYYPAFDVLLSTSSYEGLSVSMMEATSLGCPIVSSEVGGSAEITSDAITLLPYDAPPDQYATAILAASRNRATASQSSEGRQLIPELWSLLGQFGDPDMYRPEDGRSASIVDRLDAVSGASGVVQRLASAGRIHYLLSLGPVDSNCERTLRLRGVQIYDVSPAPTTLHVSPAQPASVQIYDFSHDQTPGLVDPSLGAHASCVPAFSPNHSPSHVDHSLNQSQSQANVIPSHSSTTLVNSEPASRPNPAEGPTRAAASILRTIQELGLSTLYIVNMDYRLRLLLAKILPPDGVVIYDADSPDTLFKSMAQHHDFQRRIAFDESAYFRRISPWPTSRYSST
jgi:glycosyltransferase involved in cell wall biosynthesis